MNKKSLTLKIFLFLVANDLFETFAHVCFKKSAITQTDLHITSIQDAFFFVISMLSSGYIWLGLLSVALIFVSWSTILSKIDLSVATPITSFSYVLVAIVSWLILHEHISPLRWIGILFILSGVIVVSLSSHKPEVEP